MLNRNQTWNLRYTCAIAEIQSQLTHTPVMDLVWAVQSNPTWSYMSNSTCSLLLVLLMLLLLLLMLLLLSLSLFVIYLDFQGGYNQTMTVPITQV